MTSCRNASPHSADDSSATEQRLPLLTQDLPGLGGRIKVEPGEFIVEELPAYEPCGEGEHLFLWIEKRNVSAEQLLGHIAKSLRIPRDVIGAAGMKDRRAVTRQYVSIPAACADRVASVETDAVHVLHAARHRNKLRTGHLQGNRFEVLVRNVTQDASARAAAIRERIDRSGFPNYYGEQRFGVEGETLTLGRDLLTGRRRPRELPPRRRRFLTRLALSAVQSMVFNEVTAQRVSDGLLHRVLPGDVMQVCASGGCFVVEDASVEQPRYDACETVLTGPLFGPKMTAAAGEPERREQEVLLRHGLSASQFAAHRRLLPGARRPALARPGDLSIQAEERALRFCFTLPPGSYATILLHEFMHPDDSAAGARPR